jgi:hypothetical protein
MRFCALVSSIHLHDSASLKVSALLAGVSLWPDRENSAIQPEHLNSAPIRPCWGTPEGIPGYELRVFRAVLRDDVELRLTNRRGRLSPPRGGRGALSLAVDRASLMPVAVVITVVVMIMIVMTVSPGPIFLSLIVVASAEVATIAPGFDYPLLVIHVLMTVPTVIVVVRRIVVAVAIGSGGATHRDGGREKSRGQQERTEVSVAIRHNLCLLALLHPEAWLRGRALGLPGWIH